MRSAERIVFALAAFGETGQATFLAKRANTVASPRQDFMRIALMADVEDQLIVGRVEDRMNSDGHLNHAEARPQMPASV